MAITRLRGGSERHAAAVKRSFERRGEKSTSRYIRYSDIEKISANSAGTLAAKEARINPRRIKSIATLVGNWKRRRRIAGT